MLKQLVLLWERLAKFLGWETELEPLTPILPPTIATTTPSAAPITIATTTPSTTPMNPDSITYPWDSPQHNYHNTRVLCDLAGLTVSEKNLICSCLYRESEFNNNAVCYNRDASGNVLSEDVGIAQINTYYHIAPTGSPFPSREYVVENPKVAVQYMIDCYKKGTLKMWVSYSSGAYKQYLLPTSPMWRLAS